MLGIVRHVRNYSTKIAATLASAGKLEGSLTLETNPQEFFETDVVKLVLSQYAFAVRDSLPREDKHLHDAIKRFDKVSYYTAPERELVTSTVFFPAYKGMESAERLTASNLKKAVMLSWAIENIITTTFVLDDILDENFVRWKKPCWYTLPNVGLSAILDAKQIGAATFALLRKYLKDHPSYRAIYALLSDLFFVIYAGQTSDHMASVFFRKTRNPKYLSREQHLSTLTYKTTKPLYFMPILAAVHLANLDPKIAYKSKSIFTVLGIHRQAQNDMRDCCGDFNNIGKPSTDIKGAVCTWITSSVLENGSEEQKKVLVENYGREERECHEKIFTMLREFDIIGRYRQYTEEVIKECKEHVNTIAHPGMANIINLLVEQHVDNDEGFYL